MSATNGEVLTANDLAVRWSMPVWSVRKLAREGQIPTLRIGKRVRFRLTDVIEWEAKQVVK